MLSARCRPRRALTLVELLAAMVTFSAVAGALLALVARAQRQGGRIAARAKARQAAHDAASALSSALRQITPAAGDLLVASSSEVELRATVAFSVVCAIDGSRSALVIAPPGAAGPALASWLAPPRIADTILVWAEDTAPAPDSVAPLPPGWRAHVLAADPVRGAGCMPGAGIDAAAPPGTAVAVQVMPPLPPEVALGAPVRVVRRLRFALYRAGDGRWYLGVSDCVPARATPCAVIQPVGGPYPPGGVALVYLDSSGAVTGDAARVARIDIVARGDGAPWPAAGDTVASSVSPRG